MANPTIGHIDCPICNTEGEVRRYSTGTKKLYWHCQCGQIRPSNYIGQKFIHENARFIGDNGKPLTSVKPVNEEKPVNEPRRRGGILGFLDTHDEVEI